MVDAEISDRVFGSKSGNDKSTGRKFYWDGPIEVEMPNKVQRSISVIVPKSNHDIVSSESQIYSF